MARTYDAIVLGTGGVGSAALAHLARRGLSVLGIDRFAPGHDRGSSHGQSRVIRQAYFEHPDYVPLLRAAYYLWDELQQARGETLFHRVGLVEVGPPDGIIVPGVLRSAAAHNLEIELLSLDESRRRFPGFAFPADSQIVFERNAGYLLVERCVLAHVAEACRYGAAVELASVVNWRASNDGVLVQTDSDEFHAARLVIAPGAWATQVLADLRLPLRVLRKHLHWYTTTRDQYHQQRGCPVFFFELGRDFFYGFPQFDERGVKVAEHGSVGETITDPLSAPRDEDANDRRRIDQFVARCLPQLGTSHSGHSVCFYTMTPDEHFIVDRHPSHGQVAFAAGLSGHGFKFTSVLGSILADLAVGGHTAQPIDFLRLGRFENELE